MTSKFISKNKCPSCQSDLLVDAFIKCKRCDKYVCQNCIKQMGLCADCELDYRRAKTKIRMVEKRIMEEFWNG